MITVAAAVAAVAAPVAGQGYGKVVMHDGRRWERNAVFRVTVDLRKLK